MRKFVYGSGFFLVLMLIFGGFYMSYQKGAASGKEADVQETDKAAAVHAGAVLDSRALRSDEEAAVGYILKSENDRVVVYCADGSTLFEYTDILVSELPYELQAELRNGKTLSGNPELYSFLENYSS